MSKRGGGEYPRGEGRVCPGVPTPAPDTTKKRMVGKRAVRILLECFLVVLLFFIALSCDSSSSLIYIINGIQIVFWILHIRIAFGISTKHWLFESMLLP